MHASNLLGVVIQRVAKSSKHPVHPHGEVAIVMAVGNVVDGVVAGTHHRPELPVDAVMNVCSPNGLHK